MKETPILFSGDMVRATLSGAKTQTRRPFDPAKIKVRLPREVRSDSFGLGILQPMPAIAEPGIHKAKLYGGGAVALVDVAPSLGVKPGEFHFVCPWADGDTHLGTYGRDDQRWTITPRESSLWVRETWAAALNCGAWGTLFSADGAFVQGDKHHTSGPFYDATQGPALKWRPSIHMPRWASRITLPVVDVRIERVQDITAEDAQAEGVTVPRCGCEVCSRGIVICPADATSYIEGFRDLWAATYGRESWEANPLVWVLGWSKAQVRP